jgi:DNA end-binding protein Ku
MPCLVASVAKRKLALTGSERASDARSMFKATLRVGDELVGVKLYSAAVDKDVRFHLLHGADHVRVKQRMAHPVTGETVPPEEMVRAAEVDRGTFVAVTDEELDALQPRTTREIEIERFVPPDVLDQRWYRRPYLLGPEAHHAGRYFALAEALGASELVGVARWTMRKQEYRGALETSGPYLVLVALRHAEELVPFPSFSADQRAFDKRELDLARQLVGTLQGPFDAEEFRADHRERLLDLIAEKHRGKRVKHRRFTPRLVRDDSLVAALERSLKRTG